MSDDNGNDGLLDKTSELVRKIDELIWGDVEVYGREGQPHLFPDEAVDRDKG